MDTQTPIQYMYKYTLEKYAHTVHILHMNTRIHMQIRDTCVCEQTHRYERCHSSGDNGERRGQVFPGACVVYRAVPLVWQRRRQVKGQGDVLAFNYKTKAVIFCHRPLPDYKWCLYDLALFPIIAGKGFAKSLLPELESVGQPDPLRLWKCYVAFRPLMYAALGRWAWLLIIFGRDIDPRGCRLRGARSRRE